MGSSGHRFFLEMCQIVGRTAMANLAALLLSLSAKNLKGVYNRPPPGRARVKNPYRSAAGNIRRQIIPCCRGAVSELVLGADQPAPRQFETACLCGAGGAVGDCRTSHEHRSNRRRSRLV